MQWIHISPAIDQIPAELVKAGSRIICSEIHKFIYSVWNKEVLPEEWKESIIVPIYMKGDKTNCSNYRGISLTYIILSNILLSRLIQNANEITGDHHCRFHSDMLLPFIFSKCKYNSITCCCVLYEMWSLSGNIIKTSALKESEVKSN
jgi:hypothetical protein